MIRRHFPNKLTITAVICCTVLVAGIVVAEQKNIPTGNTNAGKAVVWKISVDQAPNNVNAFGFDILYPAEVLTYQNIEKGKLLGDGFRYFGANEISPGRIRVGGMEPGQNFIKKGATGELARLTFTLKTKSAQPPVFKITEIKDDMQGWSLVLGKNNKQPNLSIIRSNNDSPHVKKGLKQQ